MAAATSLANAGAPRGARLALVTEGEDAGLVVVAGLSSSVELTHEELPLDRWQAILSVRTLAAAADPTLPAVLGRYGLAGGTLRFEPRFPLRPGARYRARFDGRALGREIGGLGAEVIDVEISLAALAPGPPTIVEAVYPSAGIVPENLLRLYIQFSAPMRRRGVAEHVRLLDDRGNEVELPFVEVPDGLWDPADRRLTLFVHPGRVKRGVGPNLALGPPLESGRTYRLVVDEALRDARGRPLGRRFEHEVVVGPADRESPDPKGWRLAPPTNPEGPLVVEFDEILDHGLLTRMLTVVDPTGEVVAGEVVPGAGESSWSFRPAEPWSPGRYALQVEAALEDPAGNRVDRRFEEPPDFETGRADSTKIPFKVR